MDQDLISVIVWPITISFAFVVCFLAWLRTKPSDAKNISLNYRHKDGKSVSLVLGHAVQETQKVSGVIVAERINRSTPSIGETASEHSIAALSRYVRDCWSALQNELNDVILASGPAPVTWQSHHKMLDYIFEQQLLPSDLQSPIRDLLVIRNKLVHKGDDYLVNDIKNPDDFAKQYAATAQTLQEQIKTRVVST